MSKFNFMDQKGRDIEIIVYDDEIKAFHERHPVGTFMYDIVQDGEIHHLSSMDIKAKYQRAGIGTEMIRLGEQEFPCVSYPGAFDTNECDTYYASEGLQLIDHCIDKGIVDKYKVYESPDNDDQYDY